MANEISSCAGIPWLNLSLHHVAIHWLRTDFENTSILTLPILLLFALVGNLAFIYVVFKTPRLHTITNIYLVNLSVADILFVLISVVFYIWSYLESPMRWDAPYDNPLGCAGVFLVTITCYLASMFLVTLVTLERYYAICNPLWHRKINGKSRTRKLVLFTWLFSIGVSACVTPRYGKMTRFCIIWPTEENFDDFPDKIGYCDSADPKSYMITEICQGVQFVLGAILNLFMYVRIMQVLSHRNLEMSTNAVIVPEEQAMQVRNQVARLLIVNGFLYFICQAGLRIVSLDNILKQNGIGFFTDEAAGVALIVSRFLLYFNSVVNPFVYNLTSSFYRQAFIDVFCCRNRRRRRQLDLIHSKSKQETTFASLPAQ